jgi:hypothetical protein
LVIADLTDEKQNVYEVGYAKARGVPLLLNFSKDTQLTLARTDSGCIQQGPFHLALYRYVE